MTWFRISLFKFLICATVVGSVAGFALRPRPSTIELFEASGSTLTHIYIGLPFCIAIPPIECPEDCSVCELNCLVNAQAQFRALDEFTSLRSLVVVGEFDANHLQFLSECSTLTELTLERGLTMKDVKHIGDLANLNKLILPNENSDPLAIKAMRLNRPSIELKRSFGVEH